MYSEKSVVASTNAFTQFNTYCLLLAIPLMLILRAIKSITITYSKF